MSKDFPLTKHSFSPEVEDYMTQNGFEHIRNGIIPEAMIFKNEYLAVVLLDEGIDVKIQPERIDATGPQILFNWESIKHYCGWDGQNMFQFMMLLDFMNVIKIKDVEKEVRKRMQVKNMMVVITELYPGLNIENPNAFVPGSHQDEGFKKEDLQKVFEDTLQKETSRSRLPFG